MIQDLRKGMEAKVKKMQKMFTKHQKNERTRAMKNTLLLPPSRFSRVRLCATPWTAAYQAFLSMGFSRQEHWSGLP